MATEIEEISSSSKFNWKIEKFSKLNAQDGTYSPVFSVGNYKWKAKIYPKGKDEVFDHITLFLESVDLTKSVDTEFNFSVTSQTGNNKVQIGAIHKFLTVRSGGFHFGCGWSKFMKLSELHDPANGYIVNDTCVITIEVTCRMKEESNGDVKQSNPEKVSEFKRQKIKDEKQ